MTTCLASTTHIPVEKQTNVTPERYTCGRPENDEGTCDQGHCWSASHKQVGTTPARKMPGTPWYGNTPARSMPGTPWHDEDDS